MGKKGCVLIPVSNCKCNLYIMGMDSWGYSRKSINDWSDRAGGFLLLPFLGCFSSCDLAFRPFKFVWAQFSTSCHTSETPLRLAASASLHAPYCNAQLMTGYVTFFLFSARAVSQSLSNAAPCQVACHFWRKYSWEQQGRTGTLFFTSPCGLFQAGKLALASVSRELYHAGSSRVTAHPYCKWHRFACCLSNPLPPLHLWMEILSAVSCRMLCRRFSRHMGSVLSWSQSGHICHWEPTWGDATGRWGLQLQSPSPC